MCQWMKRYYDLHYNGQEYDAVARRPEGTTMYYIAGGNKVNPMRKAGGATAAAKTTTAPVRQARPQTARVATATAPAKTTTATAATPRKFGAAKATGPAASKADPAEVAKLNKKVKELEENNEILEKER